MALPTHDYDKLEKEFLADAKLSIRELCRRHGIRGYSSVAAYARDHDWYERKTRIATRAFEKTVEKVAERQAEVAANDIATFRDEVLMVARAFVYRVAEDLKDPDYRIRPDDFVKIVQMAMLVSGQPTERTEERRLDLRASVEGLSAESLRRLVDVTREPLAEPAPGIAPGGDPPARPN